MALRELAPQVSDAPGAVTLAGDVIQPVARHAVDPRGVDERFPGRSIVRVLESHLLVSLVTKGDLVDVHAERAERHRKRGRTTVRLPPHRPAELTLVGPRHDRRA